MMSLFRKAISSFSKDKGQSEFSRFIRSASSREKKKVFVKVAREAAEEQRKVLNSVEFAQ